MIKECDKDKDNDGDGEGDGDEVDCENESERKRKGWREASSRILIELKLKQLVLYLDTNSNTCSFLCDWKMKIIKKSIKLSKKTLVIYTNCIIKSWSWEERHQTQERAKQGKVC